MPFRGLHLFFLKESGIVMKISTTKFYPQTLVTSGRTLPGAHLKFLAVGGVRNNSQCPLTYWNLYHAVSQISLVTHSYETSDSWYILIRLLTLYSIPMILCHLDFGDIKVPSCWCVISLHWYFKCQFLPLCFSKPTASEYSYTRGHSNSYLNQS